MVEIGLCDEYGYCVEWQVEAQKMETERDDAHVQVEELKRTVANLRSQLIGAQKRLADLGILVDVDLGKDYTSA